ncbi:glycosyltransferase family 2 protein [Chitinimonas sp. PSY-7]|uniref:glycosyltransferase n=1 Tax=Chitinimonas sp. PSY-7 TaxID=3459088 RepID=UPI00403FD3FD
MSNISVTVVVSCYNQEKYIEDAINSILSQKTNFEFQIIVADDCSTDNTRHIVRRIAENHPGEIKAILRDVNIGADKNYLDVHQQAEGEIVFHFDGDDLMLPGKLQEQYDVFQKYPDVNISFHRARYFSDDLKYVSETGWPFDREESEHIFSMHDLAKWGTIAVHGSYAYRKSSRNMYLMDRPFMEWFFAMNSLYTGTGIYLNKVLMEYRCNAHEKSYTSTKLGRLKAFKIVFADIDYYFSRDSRLKKNLYTCYLINFLATVRSCQHIELNALLFLIKNIRYFSYKSLRDAASVRLAAAPAKRIR